MDTTLLTVPEVALRLGISRAKVYEPGLVYAPEHGVVAFTVPGMAGFIQRQPQP